MAHQSTKLSLVHTLVNLPRCRDRRIDTFARETQLHLHSPVLLDKRAQAVTAHSEVSDRGLAKQVAEWIPSQTVGFLTTSRLVLPMCGLTYR